MVKNVTSGSNSHDKSLADTEQKSEGSGMISEAEVRGNSLPAAEAWSPTRQLLHEQEAV